MNQIWPIGLHQGRGICCRCAGKSPEGAWEKFRTRVEQLGGTVLEAAWKGSTEPHACLCPEGHPCTPQPSSVMRGQGLCRTCAGRDPAAARAEFLARVQELGGVVLDPDGWLGVVRDHAIRCPEGHTTTLRPVVLSQGGRLCKECPAPRTLKAEAEFRARVAELGGALHETRWLGWDRGHSATCREGHSCSPIPVNVSQGKGICPTCAGKVWDVLYVVADEWGELVKVGITSGDPRPRLADHRRLLGLDRVVRLHTGLPDGVARELERQVLAGLEAAGVSPVWGRETFYGPRALNRMLALIDHHPAVRQASRDEPGELLQS
ncbi:hypothetical protein ABZ499_27490 [Streptomyces sp. NPDC019990]|uniref:hypothetical protein n=1 Tax=Streptomyces sp. NPDC019990 TaxID=3154693 RepID=UPI0033EF5C7B